MNHDLISRLEALLDRRHQNDSTQHGLLRAGIQQLINDLREEQPKTLAQFDPFRVVAAIVGLNSVQGKEGQGWRVDAEGNEWHLSATRDEWVLVRTGAKA